MSPLSSLIPPPSRPFFPAPSRLTSCSSEKLGCRELAQHAGVPFPVPSPVGNGEAARLTCDLVIVLFSLRPGRALGSKLGEEGLGENIARTIGPHGFLCFSISPRGCARRPGFLPTPCSSVVQASRSPDSLTTFSISGSFRGAGHSYLPKAACGDGFAKTNICEARKADERLS